MITVHLYEGVDHLKWELQTVKKQALGNALGSKVSLCSPDEP